jgi:hypothetical protein
MKLLTRRRSQEGQLIFVLSPSRYFITRASLAVVGSALTSSTAFPRHSGAMGCTRYFQRHGPFAMIIDRLPRSTNVARDRARREVLATRPCNTCVGACHARRIKLRSHEACRHDIAVTMHCDICTLLIIEHVRAYSIDCWLERLDSIALIKFDDSDRDTIPQAGNRDVSLNTLILYGNNCCDRSFRRTLRKNGGRSSQGRKLSEGKCRGPFVASRERGRALFQLCSWDAARDGDLLMYVVHRDREDRPRIDLRLSLASASSMNSMYRITGCVEAVVTIKSQFVASATRTG